MKREHINKFILGYITPVILIALAVIVSYWKLSHGFFEQDEWHTFGNYIYLSGLSFKESLLQIIRNGALSHLTPLSLLVKMTIFRYAGINPIPYFYASLTFHFLVSTVVYLLILKLSGKKVPAILGAVFFAVNSSHSQAVSWLGTFEGVELSTLFGLASILFFLAAGRNKYLWIFSFISLLISLFFKETALSYLVILGVLILITKADRYKKRDFISLGLVLFIYILIRFSYRLIGIMSIPSAAGIGNNGFFNVIVYNVLTLPAKLFSLILVPMQEIIDFSLKVGGLFGKALIFPTGPWSQSGALAFDLFSVGSGLVLIILLLLFLKKEKMFRRNIFLGMIFIISSVIPILILNKYQVFIDSRFLYPATVGMSLILSSVIEYGYNKTSVNKLVKISILLIFPLMLLHIISNGSIINEKLAVADVRTLILREIKAKYPSLPKRVVFYTQSSSSYYGLPDGEKILPFQSGFGQTLLVYYQESVNFPKDFFKDDFLWGIKAQGYKEIDGRGFGYFRDLGLVKKVVADYKLPRESVIAFLWDAETNELTDISGRIRQTVR